MRVNYVRGPKQMLAVPTLNDDPVLTLTYVYICVFLFPDPPINSFQCIKGLVMLRTV